MAQLSSSSITQDNHCDLKVFSIYSLQRQCSYLIHCKTKLFFSCLPYTMALQVVFLILRICFKNITCTFSISIITMYLQISQPLVIIIIGSTIASNNSDCRSTGRSNFGRLAVELYTSPFFPAGKAVPGLQC